MLGASDRNGFPWWLSGKESARNAGLIPGSRRTPGGGNDKPLQYSCLENPMDRGAWRATVFGSQTRLSNSTTVTGMANWKDSSGIPVGIGIQWEEGFQDRGFSCTSLFISARSRRAWACPVFEALSPQGTASSFPSSLSSVKAPPRPFASWPSPSGFDTGCFLPSWVLGATCPGGLFVYFFLFVQVVPIIVVEAQFLEPHWQYSDWFSM